MVAGIIIGLYKKYASKTNSANQNVGYINERSGLQAQKVEKSNNWYTEHIEMQRLKAKRPSPKDQKLMWIQI